MLSAVRDFAAATGRRVGVKVAGGVRTAKDAVRLFQKSLDAETKAGAAVLNWLWLALAHQSLGNAGEARTWLNRACSWFDNVGKHRPDNGENRSGLHRHNWLEAHVLRRESEKQQPASGPRIKVPLKAADTESEPR